MTTAPTDQALATPAQNSENTNSPLLAVASSAVVLPVSPLDVGSEGFGGSTLFVDLKEGQKIEPIQWTNPEVIEYLRKVNASSPPDKQFFLDRDSLPDHIQDLVEFRQDSRPLLSRAKQE